MTQSPSSYVTLDAFEETGYVVLDRYDQSHDPTEWLDIHFVDWKSSGDTRFSPLASAYGDIECDGFWNHDPPKTDKDGVWVDANVAKAPRLRPAGEEPGANIGRCRVIELQPNTYAETVTATCTSTTTTGSTPRAPAGSCAGSSTSPTTPTRCMVLREVKDDPSTESRIPLPAGAQVIVDTQRLYHAVYHPGAQPRYSLITSWTSGPELQRVHREVPRRLAHRLPAGAAARARRGGPHPRRARRRAAGPRASDPRGHVRGVPGANSADPY